MVEKVKVDHSSMFDDEVFPPSALEIMMRVVKKASREMSSTSFNHELLWSRQEYPPTKFGQNKSLRQEYPPAKLGKNQSLRCKAPELPLLLNEQDPSTPYTAVSLTPLQNFKQTTPHIQVSFRVILIT